MILRYFVIITKKYDFILLFIVYVTTNPENSIKSHFHSPLGTQISQPFDQDKDHVIHLLALDLELSQLFLEQVEHGIQISGVDFSVMCFQVLVLFFEIVVDLFA